MRSLIRIEGETTKPTLRWSVVSGTLGKGGIRLNLIDNVSLSYMISIADSEPLSTPFMQLLGINFQTGV